MATIAPPPLPAHYNTVDLKFTFTKYSDIY